MTGFAPLAGIVVVDLSRYLPGPFLGRVLAELGALVVKVEPPGGDALRSLPPRVDGIGAAFRAVNAGKRSVVVDLKKAEGVDLLLALADKADVVVESFRPGVLERLGVGAATMMGRNPRLVVCSISGFGQTGDHAQVPGHDLGYLARAGVLGTFGPAGGPPQVPGIPIADIAGGAWPAAVAILAALREREQRGVGRHLDVSITRGARALAMMEISAASTGSPPPRGGSLLDGGAACYRTYETKDGRHVALAALEPEFYAAFCEAAGVPELRSSQWLLGDAAKPAVARLEALFRTRTRDEWVDVFAGVEACVEPVLSPAEVAAEGPVRLELGVPPEGELSPAPALGADTAVLATLGVDRALLARAIAAGALAGELPKEGG